VADGLERLADIFQQQGDLAGARANYERVVSIYEKAFGPDHPKTAPAYQCLGDILLRQGEARTAWNFYQRALAIYRKVLPEDHPSIRALHERLRKIPAT
jgi:tetratricopeptide (TPR) repeat protein